ncbi:hypothetical protein ABMA27_003948 [Loxostege sticticalis]|uniref:Dopamine N-acetyltransferase-like n=1 Tax=Loxostege sticticalis TaxID=481309 RepID=A0ABR3HR22_LOXSC
MPPNGDKTYTIHPVVKEDVDSVMDLLKRTFYIHEPLNEAVELWSENSPCAELDEYCSHALLEGLSFKAVDPEGNIVGVTISGVCSLKEEEANNLVSHAKACKNPKFQKILYILAAREEGTKLWERYPSEQKLVEVKVAATDPNWTRLGIMNKLVQETEKATKQLGIRILRLDTSSAYSAKSAERQGFTCIYSVPYTEIKKDGVPLIVPKPPHVDDRVYIKLLS